MVVDVDDPPIGELRAARPEAVEALVSRHYGRIHRYLLRLVHDGGLAEDLTQDTFIKAYRALPGTRPDLAFKAWLYRIATNTAISHLRRRKLVRWVPFLSDQDHATEESVERSINRKHDVEQALAKIPQHYAAALLLRHYQGLSLAETAQALEITENAAKLRLFRARKAFASAYGGPIAPAPDPMETADVLVDQESDR